MGNLYLALGDSITTGYGVGLNHSFASLLHQDLAVSCPGLSYVNLGVNGLTSDALASMLSRHPRGLLSQASLITITVGSNDLLSVGKSVLAGRPISAQVVLGNLVQNLSCIGMSIRGVNPIATVKIATIYNPLSGVNRQLSSQSQRLITNANHAIQSCAEKFNFIVIPVDRAFRGKEQTLLGSDHLHPNLMGHQVMANLFMSSNRTLGLFR